VASRASSPQLACSSSRESAIPGSRLSTESARTKGARSPATSTEYVCPCHGSRYNRNGQVQEGPARSSLRQYAATFANDVVTIAL
jgi:Rieske Fe-S protein